MAKKWIVYVLSGTGVILGVMFLNVITPENNLVGMGFGNFIMRIIGSLAVFNWLSKMIFGEKEN